MRVRNLAAATTRSAVSGALGIVVVEGVRRRLRSGQFRDGAVTATGWALRGRRRAEYGAEVARLTGADILAEARARVGETAPPPGPSDAGHAHDH